MAEGGRLLKRGEVRSANGQSCGGATALEHCSAEEGMPYEQCSAEEATPL